MAKILNSKDLEQLRQAQKAGGFSFLTMYLIDDLLATLQQALDVAIARGSELGYEDLDYRASYRVLTGKDYDEGATEPVGG